MKKNNLYIGYYLFVISSLILLLSIYAPTVSKVFKEMDINVDNKFIILTTIVGAVLIVFIAIINYHIIVFISYKIMSIKMKDVSYADFKYMYSFAFIPIAIEKLICSIVTSTSGSIVPSICLSQVLKFNITYMNFIMKLINPFSILFFITTLWGMTVLYKSKGRRIIIRTVIVFLLFTILKGDWLIFYMK